ncbi:hypothetical protein MIR68_008122 [Amoeboaphelidium protococcarum]|nr:hypothetical protein MIR68_008122 [Amoeboaphelidium protococcarum]
MNACETEQLFLKLQRWLTRLRESIDPMAAFNLHDDQISRTLGQKMSTMISNLYFAIQHEWIDEHDQDDLRAKGNDVNVKLMYLLPQSPMGSQGGLCQKLAMITEMGSDMKVCNDCNAIIWNRCWKLKSNADAYYCSECLLNCEDLRAAPCKILFQRYWISDLIEVYDDAVKWFKDIFVKSFDAINLVKCAPNLKDGKPKKRSLLTVSYWLHGRVIMKVPGFSCHRCRQRKPSTVLVACTNSCHQSSERGAARAGYYMCGKCLISKFNADFIEALRDYTYECAVCLGTCSCSNCAQLRKTSSSSLDDCGDGRDVTKKRQRSNTETAVRVHKRKPLLPIIQQEVKDRSAVRLSIPKPRKPANLQKLWVRFASNLHQEQQIDAIDQSLQGAADFNNNEASERLKVQNQILQSENHLLRQLLLDVHNSQ